MGKTIKRAIFGSPDRPLIIGDVKIPCYVLDDGTRVIVQRAIQRSLGMSTSGATAGAHRMARFVQRFEAKGLQHKDLSARIFSPIIFKPPTGGNIAYGYEATILNDLCELVIMANDLGLLGRQQSHIAVASKALLGAFSKVGIIALVDEVTGYQEIRNRDELQKILAAYVSPEFLPWTKRFPDEFYKELFRLKGWQYNPISVKRPSMIGRLTNELIYDQLPPGVRQKLQSINPIIRKNYRRYRHHQFLTEDIGNPHLGKQLASVTTLMKASPNYGIFQRLFRRAFPGKEEQQDWINQTEESSDMEKSLA